VLGHDPEGVAHELGHGELAPEVAANLQPLHDRVGDLDVPRCRAASARGRDPVAAPPPSGLLALLRQEPQAGQPLGSA
jgi:hypothetical protein